MRGAGRSAPSRAVARARGALALLAALAVVAGCGAGAAGLTQRGPTMLSRADDGSLVVEGQVTNPTTHTVERATVVVTVFRRGEPEAVFEQSLTSDGPIEPVGGVAFRVPTGLSFDVPGEVTVAVSFATP